jgi:gluconate 2-dehydrogenase gamma chain
MQKSNGRIPLTRRQFVAAGALGGAAVAAGCKMAGRRGVWESLTDTQAQTLAVLCDQIVPADEFPGATQAGVLTYIDRQLARHYSRHHDVYRDGIVQAEMICRKRFGHGLADVSSAQQFEITVALEKQSPAFFELVRKHTLEGFYGAPRHGGNRDGASWRMLGLAEPPLLGRAQYDLRNGGRS